MTAGTHLVLLTSDLPCAPRQSFWRRLTRLAGILIESIREARDMRANIRALHVLEDRVLADIGIARCGIEAAVRGDLDRPSPTIRKS
jgi:uncharacterized protein YjiS (DUF1127 family)